MSLDPRNHLLALLPEEDRQRLAADLVHTQLPRKRELYTADAPIDAVYFPLNCVVSLLVGAGEGSQVEVATIGNEGAVGAYAALAGRATASNLVQVAGDALRLDIAKFEEHRRDMPLFNSIMHKYLFALMRQIIQSGACNQLHSMEKRCARWLLMTHDRVNADTFELTQEFLAEMLAVRRATVNVAIGMLKAAGFIRYVRGQITIVDRAGLESAACPCYELIRREYAALTVA